MTYFKIYDKKGNLTIDNSSRLAKILGSINTGTKSGTFFDKNLINNHYWYFVTPNTSEFFNCSPEVSILNGIISWTFKERPVSFYTITYGIY